MFRFFILCEDARDWARERWCEQAGEKVPRDKEATNDDHTQILRRSENALKRRDPAKMPGNLERGTNDILLVTLYPDAVSTDSRRNRLHL